MNVKRKPTDRNSKECLGMTNLTNNGYFLPFFDYDSKRLMKVKNELRNIQHTFSLSDIYLIKTLNGYNAFSLDKIPFSILNQIMECSKEVDKDFKRLAFKRGFFVLRVGQEKKLQEILCSENNIYEKSLCHALALHTFFDYLLETPPEKGFDDNYMMRLHLYKSEKHGYLEVIK